MVHLDRTRSRSAEGSWRYQSNSPDVSDFFGRRKPESLCSVREADVASDSAAAMSACEILTGWSSVLLTRARRPVRSAHSRTSGQCQTGVFDTVVDGSGSKRSEEHTAELQ